MSILTQKKIDKILPGYTLVSINGELAIQAPDPGNEIVATVHSTTRRITVLETKQQNLVAAALGSVEGYIVENEVTVSKRKEVAKTGTSTKKSPKAQNVGLAGSIIQSMPEGWGDGPTTSLSWNKGNTCTVTTRSKRIATRLFGYYRGVSGVIFDGKIGKELSCTLPAGFVYEPENILFGK